MKKGAITLSINMIVILILGIIVLGLAVFFVSNIFTIGQESLEKAQSPIDVQAIDRLKASKKVIDIDRPKLEIERGSQDQILISFNNKWSIPRNFTIISESCSRIGPDPSCTGLSIEYITTTITVPAEDVTVYPINIKVVGETDKGSYIYELIVNVTEDLHRKEIFIDVV